MIALMFLKELMLTKPTNHINVLLLLSYDNFYIQPKVYEGCYVANVSFKGND